MVEAKAPPTLEATARCTRCKRVVAFMRSEQHDRPVPVHPEPQRVQALLLAGDLDAAGAALTADGWPAALSAEGGDMGYTLHGPACPVLRRRAQAEGNGYQHVDATEDMPTLRMRPPLQEPDVGTCRSCRAPVLWIRTAAKGKAVPLDPEPVHGVVLDKDQARELKGSDELVRGYNLRGEVVAVREGYRAATPLEAEDTVHLAHHGTCPDAASYRRR